MDTIYTPYYAAVTDNNCDKIPYGKEEILAYLKQQSKRHKKGILSTLTSLVLL